jgi:prepilin-type processing-associated H-X9-DG protein
MACVNNLKQLGIALHSYHGTYGCLPPGRALTTDARLIVDPRVPCDVPPDQSWLVSVLPFCEQNQLYNTINSGLTILGTENRTCHGISVGFFACPSDPDTAAPRLGYPLAMLGLGQTATDFPEPVSFTNYLGCYGSLSGEALPTPKRDCHRDPSRVAEANGTLNDVPPVAFDGITDGLSSTILVVERATPPIRELASTIPPQPFEIKGWWFYGDHGHTIAFNEFPPNAFKKASRKNAASRTQTASSLHPGGVNVLMADGSARFVKETVQSWTSGRVYDLSGALSGQGTWQKLATRAGAEVINSGDY